MYSRLSLIIKCSFRLSEFGSKGETICVNCKNNTKGEQCHQCMEGKLDNV